MNALNLERIGNLPLPAVSQLGIVVRSIEKALPFYSAFLNIRPWYRGKVAKLAMNYLDQPISSEVDMVFGYTGRLQVELIEPRGGDENLYTLHLAGQGDGLHHLGIDVRGFDKYVAHAKKSGLRVVQEGTLQSAGGAVSRMAYLDTREQIGYYIELMETRLWGLPVPKSKFMMNVGCLTGDATRVTV